MATVPAPPNLSDIKRRLSSSGTAFTTVSAPTHQSAQMYPNRGPGSDEHSSPDQISRTVPLSAIDETEVPQVFDDDSDLQDELDAGKEGVAGKLCWKESAIKAGYLMKKGERRHAWKKRYFVLRPQKFGYYKDEKEYKLLRDIPLSDIRTCAEVQVKKHDNVFGIVTNSRTYYVQAQSEAEVDDWVAKIIATAKAKKAGQPASSSTEDDDGNPTPVAGDQTPVNQSASAQSKGVTSTQPVPIPGNNRNSVGGTSYGPMSASQISSSSVQSSSSNPLSPTSNNDELGSSFTSTSSSIAMPLQPQARGIVAPHNSYAASPGHTLPPEGPEDHPLELATVDRSLSNISLNMHGADVEKEVGDLPTKLKQPPLSSVGIAHHTSNSQPSSYFAPQRNASGVKPITPGGIVSSSDDEDDFDEEPPLTPSSPSGRPALVSSYSSPHSQSLLKSGDADKIIMSGYLTKQGKRRTWRKRWFSLTSSRLSYSRSHMDTKILRQIPLTRMLDVSEYEPTFTGIGMRGSRSAQSNIGSMSGHSVEGNADPRLAAYSHCFQIITPKRTLKLCATDEESEIKWISAIRVLLAANKRASMSPPASHISLPAPIPVLLQQPPTPSVRQRTDPLQQQQQQQSSVGSNASSANSYDNTTPPHSNRNPALPSIEGQLLREQQRTHDKDIHASA